MTHGTCPVGGASGRLDCNDNKEEEAKALTMTAADGEELLGHGRGHKHGPI